MRDHDLHLVFAELKGPVRDRFVRYGITEELGKDRFFPTIGTAVSAYLRATDAQLGRLDGSLTFAGARTAPPIRSARPVARSSRYSQTAWQRSS